MIYSNDEDIPQDLSMGGAVDDQPEHGDAVAEYWHVAVMRYWHPASDYGAAYVAIDSIGRNVES